METTNTQSTLSTTVSTSQWTGIITPGDDYISYSHSSHVTATLKTTSIDTTSNPLTLGWTTSILLSSLIPCDIKTTKKGFNTIITRYSTRVVNEKLTTSSFPTIDLTYTQDKGYNWTPGYLTTIITDEDDYQDNGRLIIILSCSIGGGITLFVISISIVCLYKHCCIKDTQSCSPIVRRNDDYLNLNPFGTNDNAMSRSLGTINEDSIL